MKKIFARFKRIDNRLRPLPYTELLKDSYSTGSVVGGSLKNKTILITGASSGIGLAMARRFLVEGCHVIISGRTESKLLSAISYLKQKGCDHVTYCLMDQLKDSELYATSQNIFKQFQVNVLINNAGIFKKKDRDGRFRSVEAEDYWPGMNTNLKSSLLLSQSFVDYCKEAEIKGHILNTSSVCGLFESYGITPYGISKAGVIEMTKQFAFANKGIVTCNSIAPGSVATVMGDLHTGSNIASYSSCNRHVTMAEEIASLAALLCTDDMSDKLNGQTIKACACEKF